MVFEEFVGEHAQLWKALNSAAYFKIDPAVTGVVKEAVLFDEFVGYV